MEESGNDLDAAIKRLHELQLVYADAKTDGEMENGMYPIIISPICLILLMLQVCSCCSCLLFLVLYIDIHLRGCKEISI